MDENNHKDKDETGTNDRAGLSEPDSSKIDEAEIENIFSEISAETKGQEETLQAEAGSSGKEQAEAEGAQPSEAEAVQPSEAEAGSSGKEQAEAEGVQPSEAEAGSSGKDQADQAQEGQTQQATVAKRAEEKNSPAETKKRFWITWAEHIYKKTLDMPVKKVIFICTGLVLVSIVFVLVIVITRSQKQSRFPEESQEQLSDDGVTEYQDELNGSKNQKNFQSQKQDLDREMQQRINQYTRQYWQNIKLQYLKCGNMLDDALDRRWTELTAKYPDLLDTVELLIWEEIEYFGSETDHGTGCILVSDRTVIEGVKRKIREITRENWESLDLDKIADIPDEDWLCFRCKVFRDLVSTNPFNEMFSDQNEDHKKRFLIKLNAENPDTRKQGI